MNGFGIQTALFIIFYFSSCLLNAASWAEQGTLFLEENKKKARIVTLESGLQYKVLIKGDGPKPRRYGRVDAYYTGKLIDGTVFDSSSITKPPVTFNVSKVIRGWTEALMLMNEGSMWEVYIPSELGYGKRGAGRDIPPDSVLIFEIELVKVH